MSLTKSPYNLESWFIDENRYFEAFVADYNNLNGDFKSKALWSLIKSSDSTHWPKFITLRIYLFVNEINYSIICQFISESFPLIRVGIRKLKFNQLF